MSWLDVLILGIFAVSALIGVYRGFIKESVSLATWILAIWIAIRFSPPLADMLPERLAGLSFSIGELAFRVDNLKVGLAMLLLFVLTLLIGAVVNFLLRHLVKMANLSSTDRSLGGVFGLLRGAALVVALVMAGGLTTAPHADFWKDSLLVSPFEQTVLWLLKLLPDHIAGYFSYAG